MYVTSRHVRLLEHRDEQRWLLSAVPERLLAGAVWRSSNWSGSSAQAQDADVERFVREIASESLTAEGRLTLEACAKANEAAMARRAVNCFDGDFFDGAQQNAAMVLTVDRPRLTGGPQNEPNASMLQFALYAILADTFADDSYVDARVRSA
jgi:hypothetical protein